MPGLGHVNQVPKNTQYSSTRLPFLSPLFQFFFALIAVGLLTHCSQGGVGLGDLLSGNHAVQVGNGSGDGSSYDDRHHGGDTSGSDGDYSGSEENRLGGGTVVASNTVSGSGPGFQPTVGGAGKGPDDSEATIHGTILPPPCDPNDPNCPPDVSAVTVTMKIKLTAGGGWYRNYPMHVLATGEFRETITFGYVNGACAAELSFEATSADGNFSSVQGASGCPPDTSKQIQVELPLIRINPLTVPQQYYQNEYLSRPLPIYQERLLEENLVTPLYQGNAP